VKNQHGERKRNGVMKINSIRRKAWRRKKPAKRQRQAAYQAKRRRFNGEHQSTRQYQAKSQRKKSGVAAKAKASKREIMA